MMDSVEEGQRRRPFSMIRSFAAADVLTLGNGFCGAGAILSLMQHIPLRVSSRGSIYRVAAQALLSAGLNPVTVTTYLGIVGVTLFLLLISIRRLNAALQRIAVSNQRQVSQPDRR